ncbi:MAG: DUF3867 domain-containing protein [Clostridioides sp.]|jgi:hypothetical protein|nr:DUF3867 domain-containing protein [Clostridioides sp.]
MSHRRIIDFNEQKNKVKDSDVDKFENYIYDLYYSIMNGEIAMSEFSNKIHNYKVDNNISETKFIEIQKCFMKRYGMDIDEIEKELAELGINTFKFSTEEYLNSIFDIGSNSNLKGIFDVDDKFDDEFDDDDDGDSQSYDEWFEEMSESLNEMLDEFIENEVKRKCLFANITNDLNNVDIILEKGKIYLYSLKNINLQDKELNDFLSECKKRYSDGSLKVTMCENATKYEY